MGVTILYAAEIDILSVVNMCDNHLKMHKYLGGEKSVQIRVLHVQ